MIDGAHIILFSSDPDADRAFLRDVLELPATDIGEGWLLFAMPPSEAAVHPVHGADEQKHELYLMCSDVAAVVARMKEKSVPCTEPRDLGWGVLTAVTLPGGSELGIYQPRHPRAGEA